MKRDRSVRNHENNQFEYRSRNVLHHVWLNTLGGDVRRSSKKGITNRRRLRSIRRSSKGNGLMLDRVLV